MASGNADSAAKRLALSSGRSGSNWSEGRRRPDMEEDFPSLPGSKPGAPVMSTYPAAVKRNPVNNKNTVKKPVDDFPSLAPTSKPLQSFKSTSGPPAYRNIGGGLTKSWAASDVVQKPETTKKVIGKKALNESDFPGLTKSANSGNFFNDTKVSKNKNAEQANKKKFAEQSNLKSAADLISFNPKKSQSQDLWTEVKEKEPRKAHRNEFDYSKNGYDAPDIPGLNFSKITLMEAPVSPKLAAKSKTVPPKESDFPGLTKSANSGNIFNSTKVSKSKKTEQVNKEKVVEQSNLTLAADLISSNPKKSQSQDSWTQVKEKEPRKVQKGTNVDLNGHEPDIPGLNFTKATEAPKLTSKVTSKSNQLSTDNFPGLGPSSKQMSAHFKPSDTSKNSTSEAPKNSKLTTSVDTTWSKPSDTMPNAGKPPPGFGNFNNNNNNSKVPPGFGKMNYEYKQPRDFSTRNSSLLTKCTKLLGGGKSMEIHSI